MKLTDLSDERRASKTWLPADDRDVSNSLVVQGADGYPECADHGAMNRVHPVERIYRCSEQYCGVGARLEGREPGADPRTYFFANDGHDEPSLWRPEPELSGTPVQVLQRCESPEVFDLLRWLLEQEACSR